MGSSAHSVAFGMPGPSFYGTSSIPAWDRNHYKADPYEKDGAYRKFSPLAHVGNVKTSTLIIAGENDVEAPPTQNYEFFRALKLGVETELVVYLHERHALMEKANIIDAYKRYLEWLRRR